MYEPRFYPTLPTDDAGGTRPEPQPLTVADVIRMRQERREQIPAISPVPTDKRGRAILPPTGPAVVSFEPDPTPPPSTIKPTGRTGVEALSDAGVSLMGGFAGLVEQAGTLFGLISGDMDNAVRRIGKSSREYWDDLKSPFLKGEEKRRFEEIEKADSLLAKAWVAAKVTATSPALMGSFIPEQAAQLLPSMGGAAIGVKGAQLAGLGARATGAVGVGAAVGAGAVQQGSDVGGDAFDELMAPALAGKWSESADYRKLVDAGATDAEARVAVALKEARIAAAKGGAATVATSVIPGGLAIERLLARVPAAGRSRVVNALKGFAGEATQEAAEEGLGRVAVNQAVQAIDPSRPIESGVGEAIGLGALMGGAFGGAAGALQTPRGVTGRAADAIAGAAQQDGSPPTAPGTALVTTPAQAISGGQPLGLPFEQVAQPIPGTGGPVFNAPEGLPAPAETPLLSAPPKLLEWMTPTVIPPEAPPGEPPFDVAAGGLRAGPGGDVSRETLSEQNAAAAARARAEQLGETPTRIPAGRRATTGPLDARAPQKPAGAQWPPVPVAERTEITAAEGRPFKTAAAALRRRTTERLGPEWAPTPVDGGFTLRKQAAAPQQKTETGSPESKAEPVSPAVAGNVTGPSPPVDAAPASAGLPAAQASPSPDVDRALQAAGMEPFGDRTWRIKTSDATEVQAEVKRESPLQIEVRSIIPSMPTARTVVDSIEAAALEVKEYEAKVREFLSRAAATVAGTRVTEDKPALPQRERLTVPKDRKQAAVDRPLEQRFKTKLEAKRAMKRALFKHYTYRAHQGYGRYGTAWTSGNDGHDARETWAALKDMIGDRMNAFDRGPADMEASSDGAVTRWANTNRDAASELIRKARLLVEKKEGKQAAVATAAVEPAGPGGAPEATTTRAEGEASSLSHKQEEPGSIPGPATDQQTAPPSGAPRAATADGQKQAESATERGMTAAERERNRVDGYAEELALQIANDSHDADFSSYEAAKAVEMWAADNRLDLAAFRDAVLKLLRRKGKDLAHSKRTLERIEAIKAEGGGNQAPALPADLSRFTVTVPAADPKTGAMGTTTEKADAALARVDDQLTKARALLECLLH